MNAVLTEQQKNEAKLSEYDFILCLDASGSMGEDNKRGVPGRTRWAAMQESTKMFARDVEKIDSDGIDIVVFTSAAPGTQVFRNVTSGKVDEIFTQRQPRGSTPLAEALTEALKLGSGSKKKFILVFTDGVPDSEDAAANVIRAQANRQQTDEECTFLFVQIGDDAQASAYLRKLDDALTGAKFDIVDAKTLEEAEKFASTAELVLHAISD